MKASTNRVIEKQHLYRIAKVSYITNCSWRHHDSANRRLEIREKLYSDFLIILHFTQPILVFVDTGFALYLYSS
ncbi:hypothetical protein LXL04_038076 [Taraxacum kok-saghyz]